MAMLQARLGRLDSKQRRAARAASIFGETFWIGGVAALLGVDRQEVEQEGWLLGLEDAEIIRKHSDSRLPTEKEYGFRHGLLRDAAYGLLTPADQERGHRLACSYLEEAGERDALLLAEHAVRGQDLVKAALFYARAAEELFHRNDLSGAGSCADRSIACGAQGEMLGRMLAIQTEALFWRQEWITASQSGEAALLLLPQNSYFWHLAHHALITIAGNIGNMQLFGQLVNRLLEITPAAQDREQYCVALANSLGMLTMMGDGQLARQVVSRIQQTDLSSLSVSVLNRGYIGFGLWAYFCFTESNPWQGYACAQTAMDCFEIADSQRWHKVTMWAAGNALAALGDKLRAEALLRRGLVEAMRTGIGFQIAPARTYLMLFLVEKEDSAERAEGTALADALIERNEMETTRGTAYIAWARALMFENRLAEACQSAKKALEVLEHVRGWRPRAYFALLDILLRQNAVAEALRTAQTLEQELLVVGGSEIEVHLRALIARAYAAAEMPEAAQKKLHEVQALARRHLGHIPEPQVRALYIASLPEELRPYLQIS